MTDEIPFPDGTDGTGPALVYVPSQTMPGDDVFWVDRALITEGGPLSANDARRERMLLRALLNHALYLLGPEEGEY